MYLLAVTTAEKLNAVPILTWLKFVGIIILFIVGVIVLKKVLELNRMVVGAIIVVVVSITFFTWVQNRNEPKFLTPLVDFVAQFAPTGKALEPPKLDDPNSPAPTPTPKAKKK